MNNRVSKVSLICVVISLVAASLNANARAIRIDEGDWDEFALGSTATDIDIGFEFDFFGVRTSTMTVNPNGTVTFGGAEIAPFRDDAPTSPDSYGTITNLFTSGDLIPNGLRIQWGSIDDQDQIVTDNLFQLALFNLSNGVFALEFNYEQIMEGDDTSFIGYDNGAGTSFNLLDELGLGFNRYMGTGLFDIDDINSGCLNPGSILACNNYYAGAFDPGVDILPTGDFGGGNFGNYFREDPSSGFATQGRYLFLIDNRTDDPVTVPEPGSLWLLGAGLIGLALGRRRRML